MHKNVARYFLATTAGKSSGLVQDKKFRTLSVDNFVRKWRRRH